MIDAQLAVALEEVARASPLLVASDYDGTLARIVDDPERASPDPAAMDSLQRLSRIPGVHTAIVSGRATDALSKLTGSPRGVLLIGTHGAELPGASRPASAKVTALATSLEKVADCFPGVSLEMKPAGVAFHYRGSGQPVEAALAARAVAAEFAAKIIEGKKVVEVLLVDTDKGRAIAHLRKQLGAEAVVFLGDDVTDEDAFATLGPEDVAIKVGPEPTSARYRVVDTSGVAAALRTLEEARRTSRDSPA